MTSLIDGLPDTGRHHLESRDVPSPADTVSKLVRQGRMIAEAVLANRRATRTVTIQHYAARHAKDGPSSSAVAAIELLHQWLDRDRG